MALEQKAKDEAEECFQHSVPATNTYYNMSEIKTSSSALIDDIVTGWLASSLQVRGKNIIFTAYRKAAFPSLPPLPFSPQPVQWHRMSELGCAVSFCRRLNRDMNLHVSNAYFLVCKYSPSYFKSADNSLYREGPCRTTSCPSDGSMCVPYNGGVSSDGQLHPDFGK